MREASATVDSQSLLWPMPQKYSSLSVRVRALDSDKFNFMTASNSALLNEAFQRYMGVIFQVPAPFYPDGASLNVKELMPTLNVKVSNGDETLGEDTDESCEFFLCLGGGSYKLWIR